MRRKTRNHLPGFTAKVTLTAIKGDKTLVVFCNGSWCGQSSTMIKGRLKIGCPAHKILWYHCGMQDWEGLGLTTLKPLVK